MQHLRSRSKLYELCLPGQHFHSPEVTKLSESNMQKSPYDKMYF